MAPTGCHSKDRGKGGGGQPRPFSETCDGVDGMSSDLCRCGKPLDPAYRGVGRTLCQECHDQVCDRDTGEQRDKREADAWGREEGANRR